MKEVNSLMIYISDEDSKDLVLVEYRNVHRDFPRNFSRIEKTKYLAKNVVKASTIMELKDSNYYGLRF